MKRSIGVVAVLVVAGVTAGGLFAGSTGGGPSIASAPELPLGQNVTGGGISGRECYREFWRITMRPSDRLTINYGSTNERGVHLYILAPDITDYTYADARYVAEDYTDTKHQFRFVAPTAGRWTLQVYSCGTLAYELTAYVQHRTRTTLSGPRIANPRTKVTFRGTVSGADRGKVEIRTAKATGGWKSVAALGIRSNGSFTWTTRTSGPGTYRVRAVYPGDASHLPSSAVVSLRVVG